MRDDDLEDSRRIAPVWRRIMILLAVIAAVPVVLWSITVFVRAYVAPPTVPTFRPITASAPAPDVAVTAAPARALAAIVRNAATEESKLPAATGSIVEARATTSDARGLAPIAEGRAPASDSLSAIPEANAAAADAAPPAPWPAAPAAAATPQLPSIAEVADDAVAAGEPIAGPVPLPPHRPHVFAMVPSGIPVPRPRPTAAGDAAPVPAGVPADVNLSSRDYMK
jgi:hypothetical protein